MRQRKQKRLTAWLLTLLMAVTLLPGMGMTALAVEDGGEGNGPPAVEVVEPGDGNSGSDETEGTPPSTEPEPTTPPKSTEEDKTTEDEGGSSGSDYGIGDDTQPRVLVRTPVMPTATGDYPRGVFLPNGTTNAGIDLLNGQCLQNNSATSSTTYTNGMDYVARYDETTGTLYLNGYEGDANIYAGIGTRYSGVLTIKVERDSTITVNGTGGNSNRSERRGIDTAGRLVISGNGKLTINVTCSGNGYGIYAGYGMEITAPLEVNVSVNAPTDDKVAYGLYAYSGDISLSGGNKTIRVGSEKTANGIFNYITESGQNITNPALTVAVPTAAPNATATNERSLAVTGVYDDGSGGPVAVSWKITTAPIPKGVRLEGNTLKVTNEAEAGQVRIEASSTEGYTDAEFVTITKDAPAVNAIVATPPATGTNITIPNGSTTTSGNCGYKVYDQYGAEMTGIGATWKMEPATVTGVTLISTGGIAVNNAAKTGTVKLYATSGALESNKITFNIAREASVATSLTIEGSADNVTVPTVTEPGTTSCAYAAYTAKVKDQYGEVMDGQTIAWSVTDNPGVTINNGQLTVTNAATAGNVTITAKSGNLTATKTVTINKEAAKVSIVRITAQDGETPVTTIICTGSQRLEYYTATVYDQYGKEIQDDVNWSLDPATYSGVNYEISTTNDNIVTVKVDPNADAGSFKLVATSKTVTTVNHELNIEVKKKIDVSGKINFNAGSLPYNGAGQKYENAALDSSVTAGEGGQWTYTYTVKTGSTGTLDAAGLPKTAGTYDVKTTYEDSTNVGSKVAVLTIVPKVLHSSDLEQTGGSTTKVYDGNANSSITVGVKASSLYGADTLSITGSAVYNSANVTDANTITFTPAAITTGNYTLAATEVLPITGARITSCDLIVTPNSGQSKKFGETDPTLYSTTSGAVSGQIPSFTGALSRAEGENVGQYDITLGTLAMMDQGSSGFKASNYTLKMVSPAVKFEITKAASPTLKDITDSQKYTVTSGETAIGTAGMPADAGTLTYAKGTTESTTGTVAIDSWAVDATGKVTYTLSGGAAGDTVTLPVTIGSDNYENSTVNVVITLTKPSSSGGGGGGGVTTYAITVKSAKNGDVTASHKSAAKGTTVTLTVDPDKGYVLDTLTVLDGKDKEIKLTEKNGKYTFTMPASKVTVEAMFKASAPTGKNPFVDVPAGSYYEDAVVWAVDKGITTGTSATTFNPNGICTRAQAVTFLWRAAGSPAAKSKVMPFTDVPSGSYYYDAVLWAVENGITKGTSDTMFSPDATCTRAQIVTFLWRANGSPAVSGNSAFTDVASDAYYAAAVTWAEKNGITGGIGGGLFGSNNNCTRAQIVTFIYCSVK